MEGGRGTVSGPGGAQSAVPQTRVSEALWGKKIF